MKKIGILILSLLLISVWSCNEKKWLKEEPLSFYTTGNSYTTTAQFRQALNFLYDYLRRTYWEIGDQTDILHFGDIAYGGTDYPDSKFNNAKTWLVPTNYVVSSYWNKAYISIANANTIIHRVGLSSLSANDKAIIEGEALFFRAYYYNFLANVYGGVPISLEEATAPRTDFVTSSRHDVYDRARIDLERAITLLPSIETVDDGKVSLQAAQHLLTEVYLSLENYTAAIQTASAVISNPNMKLMTSRFGSRASETGDPYWDLFQNGNQNRRSGSGNTESILVLQYDYKNSGSSVSCQMPRNILPYYWNMTVPRAGGGQEVFAFTDWTENKGGRGIGVIHPSDYFLNTIWGADGTNDYRNSSRMIVRDLRIDNPLAAGYGQWVVAGGYLLDKWKLRHFYPLVMKFCRTSNLPDDAYAKNANGSIKTTALGEKVTAYSYGSLTSNCSLKDEYLYRLAGTYLLRAEAYVKNSQPALALADINVLRARANATPAQLSDINLNYIMDEQMRELYFEDFRSVTLFRMGKFVERTRAYNPTGYNVGDYQNLYPIPFSEIERNTTGNITQNPGYN